MGRVLILVAFVLVVALVVTLCWVGWLARQHRVRAFVAADQLAARQGQRDSRTYGHPHSPTAELWKHLPVLPGDHQWETKVIAADNGHYYLHLALVNVAQGTNVAEGKWDLSYCRVHGQPHTTCYLNYAAIADDLFRDDVIAPLVGWADIQRNKLIAGEVYDYRIGKREKS